MKNQKSSLFPVKQLSNHSHLKSNEYMMKTRRSYSIQMKVPRMTRTDSHVYRRAITARLKFYNVEFTIQMKTHCLAQPFPCLGYEKAVEPSSTAHTPVENTLFLSPSLLAPRPILEPDITLHQLGYFNFAHSATSCNSPRNPESPRRTLSSVFMSDCNISPAEFFEKSSSV